MQPKSALNIPVAIVIAGALIAGAVIFSKSPTQAPTADNRLPRQNNIELSPVTKDDHILGNPNAEIKIVEYSDMSCPFCKTFHATMERIMEEYGKTGQVAWIYRHFPLDKPRPDGSVLHPNAGYEAQASECAAELGGNDAFWAFTSAVFKARTEAGLERSELPKIAERIGLNKASFSNCLVSGKYAAKVDADYTSGINAGVAGTPFSFVLSDKADNPVPLNGAQPYQTVKSTIDAILNE
jgi:protein-disulfide isomerase